MTNTSNLVYTTHIGNPEQQILVTKAGLWVVRNLDVIISLYFFCFGLYTEVGRPDKLDVKLRRSPAPQSRENKSDGVAVIFHPVGGIVGS